MIKVSKAVPWAIFDSVSSGLLGLLTLALLTRTLSASDFGSVTFAQSIVVIVQLIAACGINEALIQRRPINALYIDSAFWAGIVLGVVGFLFCICFGTVLWWSTKNLNLALVLIVEGSACLFSGINIVPSAMLDRNLQTKIIAKRTFYGKLSYCGVAVSLAFLNFGVWSLVVAGVIQNVINTCILWSAYSRRPHFRISISHIKLLTGFGAAIMLEGVLWSFSTRIFFLLVGSFHGLQALGNLNVAVRVGDAIASVVSTVANRVGFAFFSSIQQDRRLLARTFKNATELISLVSWPVFTGLILTSSEWVPILLGKNWLTAIPLINLVCIVWVVSFSRIFSGPYLRAMGFPRALLIPALASAIVTVSAVFFTRDSSVLVVMLAWSVRCVITFPTGVLMQKRYGGMAVMDQLSPLARPFLLVVFMLVNVLVWRFLAGFFTMSPILLLVSSSLVGSVSYTSLAFFNYRTTIRSFLKGHEIY